MSEKETHVTQPENDNAKENVGVEVVSAEATPSKAQQTTAPQPNPLKQFFSKKRNIGIIGVLVAAVLAMMFFMNGPKSVIGDVTVSFEGYDGYGKLSYNEGDVKKKIVQILAEQQGLKLDLSLSDRELWTTLNTFANNPANAEKFAKIQSQVANMAITFDKETGLKNGDVVTVTITTGKDSPVKSETKQFTVSGLKETVKVTQETFLQEYPVTFVGYNNFGSVDYDDSVLELTTDESNILKNGDTLTFEISESYIDELLNEGKVYEGERTLSVQVTGLKELSSITNTANVFERVVELANARFANKEGSNKTYTIEKVKDFIKYEKDRYSADMSVDVLSIYKVHSVDSSPYFNEGTKDYYVIIGYTNLEILNDTIVLSDLSYKEFNHSSRYIDQSSTEAYLKSQDFVEYAPQQ